MLVLPQDAGIVADGSIPSPSSAIVFVNPTAGSGRARSAVPKIREVFRSHSISAEFIPTADSNELESTARRAIAKGARLLFAIGGDGTFQGLVNAAFGTDVLLGVLPAGGGNDFASTLQIPSDPARAANLLLQGRALRVDLAKVRTADGRERLYVGGGGVGIDAEAARLAGTAFRRLPGRSRYIAAALRAFAAFRAVSVCAEFPESGLPPIEAEALLGAVLNTPTYGAGIRLAPEAQPFDGWLDTIVVEDLSFLQVMALLPRLAKTGELNTPRLKRARAKAIRLTTNPPCVFHGDGELLGPTPVEIAVIPQAVQVLAPAAR